MGRLIRGAKKALQCFGMATLPIIGIGLGVLTLWLSTVEARENPSPSGLDQADLPLSGLEPTSLYTEFSAKGKKAPSKIGLESNDRYDPVAGVREGNRGSLSWRGREKFIEPLDKNPRYDRNIMLLPTTSTKIFGDKEYTYSAERTWSKVIYGGAVGSNTDDSYQEARHMMDGLLKV